jgi:hypothetical protein
MPEGSYYVYSIDDPRFSSAKPFYIGKGTGTRAYEHLPDETRTGRRIQEIRASGQNELISILLDELTEVQAIKVEAKLISAFGTEETGGILTNTVLPSGLGRSSRQSLVVPHGTREKAQLGLNLLKESVFDLAKANPRGIRNSDAADLLGLRSDYGGGSKDYLSFSILGMLLREGKLRRDSSKRHVAQVY